MAYRLLDQVTTTVVSSSLIFRKGVEKHTVQITTTGGPSAVTVDLEGSLDGINWALVLTSPLSAAELVAGVAITFIADKTVRYVRLNLPTLTGGSSPTVTALYEVKFGISQY